MNGVDEETEMTVVIAGCGDLGTETGLRFIAMGHRVIGLRRSAEKLPREIEGQSIDLSTETPSLPADISIVVIAMSPDESTPAEPTAPTAAVLREAEETLFEQIPEATILRLGGIYGPGRNRQINRIRDGAETVSLEPQFTNQIHRDDAAAAIVHLTTMQDWPETIHIGDDDCPVDQREVVEFLAHSLDLTMPSVAADLAQLLGSRGKRCRNTRLRESGFAFSYPTYREGYAAVLEGAGVHHA